MEEHTSIAAHKSVFIEEMCYRITNFVVRKDGKGVHQAFHIVILASTFVERAWDLLPSHSYRVMSVSEFASRCPWEMGLIDVYGTLVTMYVEGVDEVGGCYGKRLVIKLEDKGLASIWGNEVVTCRLHGACVGETLCSYASLPEPEGVFVLVQFVRPSVAIDGGNPQLASVSEATRVSFDPTFPEILHFRSDMLDERYLPCSPVESHQSVA